MTDSGGRRLERYIKARWGRDRGGIRGLAARTGIAADTIYGWFRGEHPPNLDHLSEIASKLEVDRYEIVAVMDGAGPLLDLAADETEALILRVVEKWARSRGLEGPDRGSGR